ncbi:MULTISPECIES: hypothetical protein [Citrobacter]|uniref:hypothetical protein n=1 Tax=Citrobacter TaxID=544 RepID=UPI000B2EE1B5|nr:hypothetical protein [Citrobacter koseri]DAL19354.1 MAG TPA_asm: hypothetical protein [Caudoviricetes sp.]MDT7495297.1 hypothetical protein [Citrobacter koseri]MDU4402332.1 hypothetical protein [Citrobacter koseri]CAG0260015.1 hypothetical protein AN2351V1_2427 [Citrobacter koseri]CAH6075493.1 hypothetical protein AN2351V1_2427 [Citrobacter koseri]
MALVKVVSSNLFSGANLQKLEVGMTLEVSDDVAERWESTGLVEVIDGGERHIEVAAPAEPKTKAKKGK